MRVDVISIFPSYLDGLTLSLVGRAHTEGLVELHTHDLRDWTHDRHRTVDDTPYGGGAGMVMRPEPWGEAIDAVMALRAGGRPRLVVPTPSGRPFTQATAAELATEPWLVFCCGRYEGIDQRVVEHYRTKLVVDELSIGDFVLSGGEVATMVMIEAVARLVPGVVGNPKSLAEESHAEGLLEYPTYTKPASWRGHDVPAVLRSGDHQEVARWRHEQARRRTADVRPDLLHPSQTLSVDGSEAELRQAEPGDAGELLTLQRACWVSEARANDMPDLPPLTETLDDVLRSLADHQTFVVRHGGRLVGSVRGRLAGDVWHIGRLMVAPDVEGRGLGRYLLEHVERAAPPTATAYELFTGARSEDNLRMYRKAGYRPVPSDHPEAPGDPRVVHLRKRRKA